MNYETTKSADGDGILEVKESAVLAYRGGGWSVAAEADYDVEPDDGGIDWSAAGAPESVTVRTLEELYQKVEEGRADLLAGRTYPLDDVVDEILRDIANGTI